MTFYVDGANVCQFVDLPFTAVKISLGLFTQKARDKEHCWRTLGYIPTHSKHTSCGQRQMIKSQQMDSIVAFPNANDKQGVANDSIPKAQDLHMMLQKIFKSYIKLQNNGFKWDLAYGGKVYKGIEFVLFTPFLKLDSDEAEKLCGKFMSQSGNVKQLCRYCECPTADTDRPFATETLKTTSKIQPMITNNNVGGSRQMSQHCIKNSIYKLCFGLHNNQGIHGACPMDMLHATLLGIFCIFMIVSLNKLGLIPN